ncbi:MAG: hypothetical protein LBT39_07440 [Treponema sp.]|jgi:hypothetical protein|nr:hypothetical protein [Treponema sp.]
MKKLMFAVLFTALVIAGVYGDGGFTVQKINGAVERESSGQWIEVSVGEVLNPATLIRTGVSASLVVEADGRSFTVRARQPRPIGELAINETPGIRKSSTVAETDTSRQDRSTARIFTNSSRQSDVRQEGQTVD